MTVSGALNFQTQITGTVAEPNLEGNVHLSAVSARPASGTGPAMSAEGSIQIHGNTLYTHDLCVALATLGTLEVGRDKQPATLQLSWRPLRLGRLDMPISGRHLAFHDEKVPLTFADLNLNLRLAGFAEGDLLLSGDVDVDGATFDRNRHPAGSVRKPPEGRWYQALPPHLSLDLTLHGAPHALTVTVPILPSVATQFECHVVASAHGAHLSGQLRGSGAYSRTAVALYDWFTPGQLRHCQVLPP
jgi:hypothetical protein